MSGGGLLFSFIPRIKQLGFVRLEYPGDLPEFRLPKAFVPAQLHGCEPKFGFTATLMHMHMCRFVRLRTIESNPIAFHAEYGRHGFTVQALGCLSKPACARRVNSPVPRLSNVLHSAVEALVL